MKEMSPDCSCPLQKKKRELRTRRLYPSGTHYLYIPCQRSLSESQLYYTITLVIPLKQLNTRFVVPVGSEGRKTNQRDRLDANELGNIEEGGKHPTETAKYDFP